MIPLHSLIRPSVLLVLCLVAHLPVSAIDPVRPGDQVEVYYHSKWYPGEVLAYKNKVALVRYTFISPREGKFALDSIRFPNDEGSWMIWRDLSGKFKIEARLVGRSETHVKLMKEDGSVAEVPIASLAASLQARLAKIVKAEKEFVDSALVRIGDQVEVKHLRTWTPATVISLLPDGAVVEYSFAGQVRQSEFKYVDMRYPNGEGPWSDWKDVTGKYQVKARYITHDETDVYLLLEGDKRIKLPRSKLAPAIETELAKRAVLTRRPDEVEFSTAGVDFKDLPSWTRFGKGLGENTGGILSSITAPPSTSPADGVFKVELERVGKIGPVFYVDDAPTPMICLVVTPEKQDGFNPISLYWIDLETRSVLPGPNFFEGEVILGYSAAQQRLITAEGLDLRKSASRFCSYRLAAGQRQAKPEWKWAVPEMSFVSSRERLSADFVGSDNVLIAYGGAVTMWDLEARRAEYVVPTSYNDFDLSPDQRFFFTNQFNHATAIDTGSGEPVATFGGASSHFTQDGTHVTSVGTFSSELISLANPTDRAALYGGKRSQDGAGAKSALIGTEWLFRDNHLYNLQRQLLSWTYATEDLTLLLRQPVGNRCLIVATDEANSSSTEIHVGVKTIPSDENLASMTSLGDEQLYVLRPGIQVRLDASAMHPQIVDGVRRAIQEAGWSESATSDIVIKAEAKRGKPQTQTYSVSRFGFGSGGGSQPDQTITASPWMQYVSVEQAGKSLWGAGGGGAIPSFVTTREGESLEAEIRKCEQVSYDLFQTFTFPEKVLAPKWANGFGTTMLTPTGFVDRPVAP
ncbi:SHD1 domain-containing protein [Rosistilla oblonga]|uniref:SHD1 domain-containing protein n=1 Tax=Rosistilla oblonga TaxID=2527990 RepID=UPI003A96E526